MTQSNCDQIEPKLSERLAAYELIREGDEKGKSRSDRNQCGAEGCTKNALKCGLCRGHDAEQNPDKYCSHDSCTHLAQGGGVCTLHGGKRKRHGVCSVEACTINQMEKYHEQKKKQKNESDADGSKGASTAGEDDEASREEKEKARKSAVRRAYYLKNKDKILAKQMENYYKKQGEKKAKAREIYAKKKKGKIDTNAEDSKEASVQEREDNEASHEQQKRPTPSTMGETKPGKSRKCIKADLSAADCSKEASVEREEDKEAFHEHQKPLTPSAMGETKPRKRKKCKITNLSAADWRGSNKGRRKRGSGMRCQTEGCNINAMNGCFFCVEHNAAAQSGKDYDEITAAARAIASNNQEAESGTGVAIMDKLDDDQINAIREKIAAGKLKREEDKKARRRAINKAYYLKKKESILARNSATYLKHNDERRAHYLKNKDEILAKRRADYMEHQEERKAKSREAYAKKRDSKVDTNTGGSKEASMEGSDGDASCEQEVAPRKQTKRCSREGCTKYALKCGVCRGHDAEQNPEKYCSRDSCTRRAQSGGACALHGGKICSREGCTKDALKCGLCRGHDAEQNPDKYCSHDSCIHVAQRGGVCILHGGKKRNHHGVCSVEGCTNQVVRRGVCWRHGGDPDGRNAKSEQQPDDPTTLTEEEYNSILNPDDVLEMGHPRQSRRAGERNALPAGWEEMTEPDTGRKFYIDHNTRTTSWERPQPSKKYWGRHTRANQRYSLRLTRRHEE